jgi:hypothetical protein
MGKNKASGSAWAMPRVWKRNIIRGTHGNELKVFFKFKFRVFFFVLGWGF